MSLISYVKKNEATGIIARIYDNVQDRIKVLPNVIQFHTASPELFPKLMQMTQHFTDHPTIDSVMVSYIRMLVSNLGNCEYCIKFQYAMLKMMGISEEDLKIAMNNYHEINLERKRKELIVFVCDMMNDSLQNTESKIELLKNMGWMDKDIYEACVIGAMQRGMIQLIKAFKVEIDF